MLGRRNAPHPRHFRTPQFPSEAYGIGSSTSLTVLDWLTNFISEQKLSLMVATLRLWSWLNDLLISSEPRDQGNSLARCPFPVVGTIPHCRVWLQKPVMGRPGSGCTLGCARFEAWHSRSILFSSYGHSQVFLSIPAIAYSGAAL